MGSKRRGLVSGGRIPNRQLIDSLLQWSVLAAAFGVPLTWLSGGVSPFGPPKFLVLGICSVGAVAAMLLSDSHRKSGQHVLESSPVAWAGIAFAGLALLSTATSEQPLASLFGTHPDFRGLILVLACGGIGLGAAVASAREAHFTSLLMRCAAAFVMAVSTAGVLQGLSQMQSLKSWQLLRVSSTPGNPSNFGVVLVVALPLAIFVAVSDSNRVWRWIGLASSGLGLLAVVWTNSRGAWFGLIAAVAVALGARLISPARGRSERRATVIIAGLAAGLSAALLLTPRVLERIASVTDLTSKTIAWRLSAWGSSFLMIRDRPFLGWGPNAFRFSYPAYQGPGQIDGAKGYQVVEAAHSLLLDTGVSLGIPGLAALLFLVGAVGVVLWRQLRSPAASGSWTAVTSALAAGLVALSFHYATLDSAPLLAVLLGVCAGAPSRLSGVQAPSRQATWIIPALGVLLVVLLAGASAAGLMLASDRMLFQAGRDNRGKVEWGRMSAGYDRAAMLAGFDPMPYRQRGAAATAVLRRTWDADAFRQGLDAYDEALQLTPYDATLVTERANLLLVAAQASGNARLANEALRGFTQAVALDPNTGMPHAGRGGALVIMGRWEEARDSLERAVELSPRDRRAWRTLATVYGQTGQTDERERALRKASGG